MSSAALIFPHQLFSRHPVLKKDRPVVLVEDTLYFGDATASPGRFHKQKIVLHRASMKAYADSLARKGYDVDYIEYNRDRPVEKIIGELAERGIGEIHTSDPHDFLLEKRLKRGRVKLWMLDKTV